MTSTGPTDPDFDPATLVARIVVEGLVQRDLDRRIIAARRSDDEAPEGERGEDTGPSDLDLWHFARRRPGEPVPFAVAARLRHDDRLRRRYANLMRLETRSHSVMAMAAFSGGMSREVGAYVVRLVTADDDLPAMLVISPRDGDGVSSPRFVEVMAAPNDEDDGSPLVRVALPAAVRGHTTLPLADSDPELARLADLMARPTSSIWLS